MILMYGVPLMSPCRLPTARKRLAVPFRAAHTPSQRSEFAQPDTALLLTLLSYYTDGLSKKELLEALQTLLGLGMARSTATTMGGFPWRRRCQPP